MSFVRTLLLGVLLSMGLAVLAEPAAAQNARTVSRSVALDRDGQVTLDTFTGRIDVTAWDQNRVQVEARIESDDAELVEKTALRFDATDQRLSIEVDYDEVKDSQEFLGLFNIGDVDRPAVEFTIKMPRTAALTVDDFSSEISVTGLRANLTLDTFSSTITLRDVEGVLDLETFSGEVEGEDLRGEIQLETFSGDARLRIAALAGDSHFETFSGDVELTLPADASFEIVGDEDAFGDLDSEFAFRAEDGRRIVGDGGARIEVETFSGDLRLRKL
jgi:DUF4097 and DUF4098 domain-containing protein YvlB